MYIRLNQLFVGLQMGGIFQNLTIKNWENRFFRGSLSIFIKKMKIKRFKKRGTQQKNSLQPYKKC
jgi:hypothetical protein